MRRPFSEKMSTLRAMHNNYHQLANVCSRFGDMVGMRKRRDVAYGIYLAIKEMESE